MCVCRLKLGNCGDNLILEDLQLMFYFADSSSDR